MQQSQITRSFLFYDRPRGQPASLFRSSSSDGSACYATMLQQRLPDWQAERIRDGAFMRHHHLP